MLILQTAYDLSETDENLALQYIDSVERSERLTKATAMHLLLLDAKMANRRLALSRQSDTLRQLESYYESYGSPNEKMLLRYIIGCSDLRKGDLSSALANFELAAGFADTSSNRCDYKTLCRIYAQKALLFHRQMSPNNALSLWDKVHEYAIAANDTFFAIMSYSRKSSAFKLLDKTDSVVALSEKAAHLFNKYGYRTFAASEYGALIPIYAEMGNYRKAKQYIDIYEKESGMFNKKGDIKKGSEVYYYGKGLYFLHKGDLDSAEVIFRKEAYAGHDYNNLQAAYKGLFLVYKKKENRDSISKYAELWNKMTDSAFFYMSTIHLQEMKAMYDYEVNERIAAQKTNEANKAKMGVVLLFLILALVIMAAYLGHTRKNERIKNMIKENALNIILLNKKETELQMLKSGHDVDAGKIAEKEKEITILQKKISYLQGEEFSSEEWKDTNMMNAPIIDELHKKAMSSRKASVGDLSALGIFAKSSCPSFLDSLNIKENKLSERDVNICLLTRLRFMTSEISCLLGISAQILTNQRIKMNKKLFGSNEGAKHFDYMIRQIPLKNPTV